MDIHIRHAEKADFAAIKRIYEQPTCYGGTLQLPFPSDDLWRERLDKPQPNHYSLVAIADGEIAGQIGIEVAANVRRRHTAHIGMGVREEYRGQGIGSKLLEAVLMLATDWLAVSRVELEVYKDNEAAVALYKKHGFVVEGECRDYAFRNGAYVDVYLMARLSARP